MNNYQSSFFHYLSKFDTFMSTVEDPVLYDSSLSFSRDIEVIGHRFILGQGLIFITLLSFANKSCFATDIFLSAMFLSY